MCKFRENRSRDMPLWGIYIQTFSEISVKFSVSGARYPYRCTNGGDIWHGPLLHAKFHSNLCNVSPLWGEKPQNRPLSNLNTGATGTLHCAQCCK